MPVYSNDTKLITILLFVSIDEINEFWWWIFELISFKMNSKRQTSIHKIRELNLEYININQQYDIIKEIGCGDYGKVILAFHRDTNSQVKIQW